MSGITWLHLSDWHQKGKDFDRRVVRDALIRDIEDRTKISPDLARIDFIVFSGDVAFSGKPEEYESARNELFDPILKACDISKDKLFIVPGNHDLDRNAFDEFHRPMLFGAPFSLAKARLKDNDFKAMMLEPFQAFTGFVANYTSQESPNYASIRIFVVGNKKIALLGINSAWASGRHKDASGEVNDRGYTLIGEPQINDALEYVSDADLKIAVLHHPFEWLNEYDRIDVEKRLIKECDFILQGHQHKPSVTVTRGIPDDCVIIPAGACYDRRRAKDPRYINAFNFVHLDLSTRMGTVFFRCWSEAKGQWIEDNGTLKRGKYGFRMAQSINDIVDEFEKAKKGRHSDIKTETRPEHISPAKINEGFLNTIDVDGNPRSYPLQIEPCPIADTWSKIDLLYFSDYAKAIVDLIKNEKSSDPLVIGIDAAWGMGKTTLMHMIDKELLQESKIKDAAIYGAGALGGLYSDILNKCYIECLDVRLVQLNDKKHKLGEDYPNAKLDVEFFNYRFPTVWFNAWKYDKEKSLLAALVIEILGQIKDKYGYGGITFYLKTMQKRFGWKSVILSAIKLLIIRSFVILLTLSVFIWLISTSKISAMIQSNINSSQNMGLSITLDSAIPSLVIIGFSTIGALLLSYKTVIDIYKDPLQLHLNKMYGGANFEDKIGFIREFEKTFSNIISIVTEKHSELGIKKLIIFIDDLDRCKPPKPVEVIEAISTILDAQNCVFIIGMDMSMVERSIETKYMGMVSHSNNYEQNNGISLGKSFLEKIVQIDFCIPNITPDNFDEFTNKTLYGLKGEERPIKEKPPQEKVDEAIQLIELELDPDINSNDVIGDAVDKVRNRRPDLSSEVIEEAKNSLFTKYLFEEKYDIFEENQDVLKALKLAPKYLGLNPRKMKRFINNFRLQAIIANRRGLLDDKLITLSNLSKLIILDMRWPKIFDSIKEDKALFTTLKSREGRIELLKDEEYKNITTIIESKEFIDLINEVNIDISSLDLYLCLANVSPINNDSPETLL